MKRGIGTIITNALNAWYIKSHVGCYCNDLASELDSTSVEKIEAEFNSYVDKFLKSIDSWRSTKIRRLIPPPPRIVVEEFLRWAIEEYKKS